MTSAVLLATNSASTLSLTSYAYIFILAAFLGFVLISKVPSILHTPLMSGTNAIHGIILVGAISLCANAHGWISVTISTIAVALGATNVVGGFVVTDRILEMFRGSARPKSGKPEGSAHE